MKGLKKIVPYIESSLNRRLVKPREFIKKLLVRIQETRHLVVILGVRYTGIQLYSLSCRGR